MKRKNIEIIVIAVLFVCTILLYVVQSNKEVLFNTTNKSSNTNTNTTKESNSENIANARDGIQGVVQPSPFITTPNGVEANLLQNANGSLIGN